MSFHNRQLIRIVNAEAEVRLYRVLEIHPGLEIVCLFDCTQPPPSSTASPERKRMADIETMFESGQAVLMEAEDDPFRPADTTGLTPLQRDACKENYAIIQRIVEEHSVLALTDRGTRAAAVSEACQPTMNENGKVRKRTRKTVWALLRAWWRGGMVHATLVPNYRARGNREIKEGNRKPGRKPLNLEKRPEWAGVSLSPADVKKLQKGFERFHLTKRMVLEVAYGRTLLTYWPVFTKRTDGTVECSLPPTGTAPSFRQWYYHGQKLLKDKDKDRRERRLLKRYGEQAFDNNMRPEMLSVSRLSEGPGWFCQYDATPFPIALVREDDRSQIIGSPLMFTMTDVATHFIFTPYITLENETFGASQRGLYEICRKHTPDEPRVAGMPSELGLPRNLAVDRGPYMSLSSDSLPGVLGVRVEQGRSYFPLARQLIEATHIMIQLLLKELGGTYDWRPSEYGTSNPALNASMTLSEFRQAVLMAVNYLNEWSEIENYPFDADMITGNLRPYRLDLWEFCQGRRPSGFHVWPDEHLMLHLMPGDEAKVSPKGLLYEGQHYTCDRAITEDWFGEEQRRLAQRGRRAPARKVPIARHWSLRDVIYLRLPGQRKLEPCTLVDQRSAWQGKTWQEYKAWEAQQKLARQEEARPRLQARIDLTTNSTPFPRVPRN